MTSARVYVPLSGVWYTLPRSMALDLLVGAYIKSPCSFGALVRRHAKRISGKPRGATFTASGWVYDGPGLMVTGAETILPGSKPATQLARRIMAIGRSEPAAA